MLQLPPPRAPLGPYSAEAVNLSVAGAASTAKMETPKAKTATSVQGIRWSASRAEKNPVNKRSCDALPSQPTSPPAGCRAKSPGRVCGLGTACGKPRPRELPPRGLEG